MLSMSTKVRDHLEYLDMFRTQKYISCDTVRYFGIQVAATACYLCEIWNGGDDELRVRELDMFPIMEFYIGADGDSIHNYRFAVDMHPLPTKCRLA